MTMNLIEQQSAAKDLPLQYLQQAVNGQNPNLTPWIATAELQRRTTMNQHMQKGPDGPMPTVKDQVEQKAGLMATQAAQQAQGAQMQQAAMPPGPVPESTPQPEAQPEQPVMAARGGLMNAPNNLRFAAGGIMGFAGDEDGSYVDPATGIPLVNTSTDDSDETLREYITRGLGFTEEAKRQKANRKTNEATEAKVNRRDTPAPREVSAAARANDKAPLPSLQGQGIKAALPKAPPAGPRKDAAAAAVTEQQGPPQLSNSQKMLAGLQGYANEPTEAATLEKAIADQKALQAAFGTDKPVGEMQEKYMAQQDTLQARRQKQAEDLAWSAYVQGTVGTPGSGALAYDTTKANALNQAGEFQTQRYKSLADLDTARRTAAEKQQAEAGTAYGANKTASALERSNKAQIAANVYGTERHAESAMAIAKLQERAANARHDSTEKRLALQELHDREVSYDNDIKYLIAERNKLIGPLGTGITPQAKQALEELDAQIATARDLKSRVRPSTGATPAGVKITPAQAAALAKYGAQ